MYNKNDSKKNSGRFLLGKIRVAGCLKSDCVKVRAYARILRQVSGDGKKKKDDRKKNKGKGKNKRKAREVEIIDL